MSDAPSSVPFARLPSEAVTVAFAPPKVPLEPRPRLWPGAIILILQWFIILVPGWIAPVTMAQFYGWFLGPLVGTAGLMVWWLFASRLRWADRLLCLLAFVAVGAVTFPFWHESWRDEQTYGIFGLVMYALPLVTTTWVLWLVITPFLRWRVRRAGLLLLFVLTWGVFLLVRNQGVYGSFSADFQYRWSLTDEEQLLADIAAGKLGGSPAQGASAAGPNELQPGDWPGFRGPNRDGRLTGVRIATDWEAHAPQEVWRHRIGPGWGSFAVVGTRLFTQEQRGAEEVVVCYDAESGKEIWAHSDDARFSEMMAGPGPRATPTFHEGKVYTLGARGKLNCLEAATGRVVWSQDIKEDSGAEVPQWGFAASPLVAQGMVIVFAGGPDDKSVLAYQAASGKLAWSAGKGQFSYCSLHPAQLDGVEQALIATGQGLTAFDPEGGKVLWEYSWPLQEGMARVVQPTLVGGSEILIGTGFGIGSRKIRVHHEENRWTTKELWTSRAFKPYYNDQVVHAGHVYGFDNNFLTCVSLADGKSKWRARGYGNGQVLLLADQDLLLVLTEKGEVALVEARPDGHKETARFQAIEGKTWNHPVVARGKLFVRNGAEAACYELVEDTGK
jgi:outer membrane protein assembly factor BamB